MKTMSYFTETMRCVKNEEKGKARDVLTKFLNNTPLEELQEITRESNRGSEILAMRSNSAFIEPFIEAERTNSEPFGKWISDFSRSWNLLN